jgi:carboxymethylenebutenolidase
VCAQEHGGKSVIGFQRHVFVCLNERDPSHPKGSCKHRGAAEILAYLKARIARLGLQKTIRINQAGCMEHCEYGPSIVVYPEAAWYRLRSVADAAEVFEQHIIGGAVVPHLLMENAVATTRTASWHETQVGDSLMRTYVSTPSGAGPFPGVVVIQHRGGVDEFTQEMTDRLADAGFVGAAPDLYHRDGAGCQDPAPIRRQRLRDVTVIQDVNATVDLLRAHPLVREAPLGIVGFCMGGRMTYLMAAVNPAFKAAVPYYGGGIMASEGEGPTPFERSRQIHCPILFHFGADDKNPSPEDMRKLDEELDRHAKVHEFHSYPGAGHAFMNRRAETYRPDADAASWPRTIQFLNRCLRVPLPETAAAEASRPL